MKKLKKISLTNKELKTLNDKELSKLLGGRTVTYPTTYAESISVPKNPKLPGFY